MLAGLLLNLEEYGDKIIPKMGWLKSQRERDRLLREDEDLLAFVTTVVTQGVLDGTSM